MRAATFAQQAGRAVAFALAAFRQTFAAGRDLSELDNVLMAAAACELHPNAVLKGIELQSDEAPPRAATDEALARGVRGVPTVAVGDQVFLGDDRLEEAAAALRENAPTRRDLRQQRVQSVVEGRRPPRTAAAPGEGGRSRPSRERSSTTSPTRRPAGPSSPR